MPPPPAKPAAVIFDWDNTLVDSWPVIHDALNTTFRAFDVPEWTLDQTRQRVRHSMRDSFPAIFGARWRDAGEVFYARYAAIHAELVTAAADAETLLARLAERGIYMAVVSNKKGDFLRAEATHLGWNDYFGGLVGANDAVRDKPDPAPVAMALAPGGEAPGPGVWFVGDADIDLACGARAGCVPVLLRAEAPGPDEFADAPPTLHFESCRHLCNFLETM